MPEAESTFIDWQRVEQDSRLLIDEDFSWSEASFARPASRARLAARGEAHREVRVARASGSSLRGFELQADAEFEPEPASATDSLRHGTHALTDLARDPQSSELWERPRASIDEVFDLRDPGAGAAVGGGRRTVIITGHGNERHLPVPRQRVSSTLRFHERSGFSPDRAGLWAVLLGLALLIGCIAH